MAIFFLILKCYDSIQLELYEQDETNVFMFQVLEKQN